MGVQFRRAAGEVQNLDAAGGQQAQDVPDGVRRHLFLAPRAGIDVAVQALLIAAIAQIDLQGLQAGAAQGGEIGGFQ